MQCLNATCYFNITLVLLMMYFYEFPIILYSSSPTDLAGSRKAKTVLLKLKRKNSLMHAYANTGASSTNIMFLKLGVDGTRSGRAHQRCHHCRWLLRAIIEPQMEHVKVASGGRDGRRLAWLLPLGSLLMGPLVFKRGFSTKKTERTQHWQKITWRLLLTEFSILYIMKTMRYRISVKHFMLRNCLKCVFEKESWGDAINNLWRSHKKNPQNAL